MVPIIDNLKSSCRGSLKRGVVRGTIWSSESKKSSESGETCES
jgi:hypothetical protein